ncbi:hypothetical protein L596_021693 [Steinernema carpocapsae]|uniref:Uncharacterized protein n=1 Tax=Steinernema carpocapsae TaxID=34508 RepID=A0A4U5MJH7_STECR|nr:hypothetical protein L596_021693 [Steinernema carpocapsae]
MKSSHKVSGKGAKKRPNITITSQINNYNCANEVEYKELIQCGKCSVNCLERLEDPALLEREETDRPTRAHQKSFFNLCSTHLKRK